MSVDAKAIFKESFIAEVATWPTTLLVGVLDVVTDRLNEIGECVHCDGCGFIFPREAIVLWDTRFPDGDYEKDNVVGQAVSKTKCSECYKTAQREALEPLLEALAGKVGVTVSSFDLSALFAGKPDKAESDDEMPGQYL